MSNKIGTIKEVYSLFPSSDLPEKIEFTLRKDDKYDCKIYLKFKCGDQMLNGYMHVVTSYPAFTPTYEFTDINGDGVFFEITVPDNKEE